MSETQNIQPSPQSTVVCLRLDSLLPEEVRELVTESTRSAVDNARGRTASPAMEVLDVLVNVDHMGGGIGVGLVPNLFEQSVHYKLSVC